MARCTAPSYRDLTTARHAWVQSLRTRIARLDLIIAAVNE